MRCNKARQEIIWERHHGAGSVVPFSLQAGNDIFFRFYLTKAEDMDFTFEDAMMPSAFKDLPGFLAGE